MSLKTRQLGVTNAKFSPCSQKPNSVSTQTTQDIKKVDPLAFNGTLEETYELILKSLKGLKKNDIVTKESNYLHVTFTSKLFKFVDDVEFYFDEKAKLIHFKSASRVGYSDMGVNKKRYLKFKETYLELLK